MLDGWICLMVNAVFKHGEKDAVEREISSIFGKDLLDTRVVCNDAMRSSTGEYYLFVRCLNWEDHADRLERSSAVVSVVPSYGNPHLFTESEIRAFSVSTVEKKPGRFRRGDMVLVREGYLKNLYGVVESQVSEKRCRVAFSFHLRKFLENIPVTWMKKVANIFENRIKSSSGKEPNSIAKRRNLCRKKSRKHEGRAVL